MQVLEYDVRWGRIEVLTHAWRFLCSCFFLNHAKCTDPPMLLDGTERPLLPKWWYILRIALYSSSRSHQIEDLLVVVVLKIPPSFTALSACYRFDLPGYLVTQREFTGWLSVNLMPRGTCLGNQKCQNCFKFTRKRKPCTLFVTWCPQWRRNSVNRLLAFVKGKFSYFRRRTTAPFVCSFWFELQRLPFHIYMHKHH